MLARYVNWLARLPRTWTFAVCVMIFLWVLTLLPLWVANVFEVFLTLRDRLRVFSSRIGGCAVVVVWSC